MAGHSAAVGLERTILCIVFCCEVCRLGIALCAQVLDCDVLECVYLLFGLLRSPLGSLLNRRRTRKQQRASFTIELHLSSRLKSVRARVVRRHLSSVLCVGVRPNFFVVRGSAVCLTHQLTLIDICVLTSTIPHWGLSCIGGSF